MLKAFGVVDLQIVHRRDAEGFKLGGTEASSKWELECDHPPAGCRCYRAPLRSGLETMSRLAALMARLAEKAEARQEAEQDSKSSSESDEVCCACPRRCAPLACRGAAQPWLEGRRGEPGQGFARACCSASRLRL